MSARDTLTPELRAEVLRLEDDLRARVPSLPEVQSAWREEYDAARAAERTAAAWEAWVDERVTLAAVAWVLTTVFVRFCEDNGLVKPVWISGPRSREAIEAQQQFLRETARTNADVTDREWLLEAVEHLKSLPATAGLVDDTSPMWLVTPSGDAATRLLTFWRERDESGALIRDLSDPDLDTRFLGDVYQDISDDAKKRYALLQTPVFVEEFILERTLEPALNERPLEGFKMIDPTCGSGHFLLGGFQRLLERWHKHAPGLDERERVQAALDSVYGVDINPFAVAIARFRLTVAALQACGLAGLEDAPAFKYHLAAGDSLLHGLDQHEFEFGSSGAMAHASEFFYATENVGTLKKVLANGTYDAVVGNPPYIQPNDEALNQAYRRNFASIRGKYQLTVPFMERFFSLARSGSSAGWVGQITGNGFMKKQFGSDLVEKFLPQKDLRLLIDASGAYIPGHGTPTVILVGTNARPVASRLRAVLGIRAEPSRPSNPAEGQVWSSIQAHVDSPGWEDTWVSVVDLDRSELASHPWSLAGGGAAAVRAVVDRRGRGRLGDRAVRVGFFGIVGADEAFVMPSGVAQRKGLEREGVRDLVFGDGVRDFGIRSADVVWFPYDSAGELVELSDCPSFERYLWPARTVLGNRATFSKGTYFSDGRAWYSWHQLARDNAAEGATLCFAQISTHNHFALHRGNFAFNSAAPVIKLPVDVSEAERVALVGVLNSSTACFWLRQVCDAKGGSGMGRGIQSEAWMERFMFNSTNVEQIPLPPQLPATRAMVLDRLATELAAHSPDAVIRGGVPSRTVLDAAAARSDSLRGQMLAMQEELDWETYRAYEIVDVDLTMNEGDLPELKGGERAFEIVLARRVLEGAEQTAWFERHGYEPITELPSYWPVEYRALVQSRIELIESHPHIRLLERPEHKRRWVAEHRVRLEERALREWLLDRLEQPEYWFDSHGRPVTKSLATLADDVARDPDLSAVMSLWVGRQDVALTASLEHLVADAVVPYLAAHRYSDAGIRKRAAWEQTWELQRREDAGTYDARPRDLGGSGPVPVPPRYSSTDFRHGVVWANRGRLDMPKERFVAYPGSEREGDPTTVIGWAGWNQADQSLALAALIQSGEQQGWSEGRLIPLVAGLSELLPWVEQWHSEPDSIYGGSSPAEFFAGLLDNYMAKLGQTRESLAGWRPPAATRGRKAKP